MNNRTSMSGNENEGEVEDEDKRDFLLGWGLAGTAFSAGTVYTGVQIAERLGFDFDSVIDVLSVDEPEDQGPGYTPGDETPDYPAGEEDSWNGPVDSYSDLEPEGCAVSSSEWDWLEGNIYNQESVDQDSEDIFDLYNEGRLDVYRDGNELRAELYDDTNGDRIEGWNIPEAC